MGYADMNQNNGVASMMKKFAMKTKEALGYYVYVYSDPDTHKPFYVGKGKGDRVFNHLSDQSESDNGVVSFKCSR